MLKRFQLSELEKIERPYGYLYRVPAKDEGFENLRLHIFVIKPGEHTSKHHHPFEEIFYILEGSGILIGKETEYPVRKEDIILIPKNELHQLKNSDDKNLIYIVAMSPPRKEEEISYVESEVI